MGIGAQYKDIGCNLHSTCLGCPIPVEQCPTFASRTSHEIRLRNISIKKDYLAGMSRSALATKCSVSVTTIARALRDK